jgi:hypothetical protein
MIVWKPYCKVVSADHYAIQSLHRLRQLSLKFLDLLLVSDLFARCPKLVIQKKN